MEANEADGRMVVIRSGHNRQHLFYDYVLGDHARRSAEAKEEKMGLSWQQGCSYYDIGDARLAAWSYREAYPGVARISDLVSFEPDIVLVQLDGSQLHLEPGQSVFPHGPHRDLDVPGAIDKQP
jgi:Domain of unknown function (DUF427)